MKKSDNLKVVGAGKQKIERFTKGKEQAEKELNKIAEDVKGASSPTKEKEELTPDQKTDLTKQETIIRKGQRAFLESCKALLHIKENDL